MKVLNLPGGGTKFVGIVTLAKRVIYSFKPDVITGISAGAIAAVPVAMGLWDCVEIGLRIKLEDFFDISPVTDKGKIRLTKALITHGSLGVQNVGRIVKRLITKEVYQQYLVGDYPTCYVQAVSTSGERRVWNLKECSYEEYLQAVAASAAIPLFTQGVWIDGVEYYDGGLRDVTMSQWVLDNLHPTEVVSIFAKPERELMLPVKLPRIKLLRMLELQLRIVDILMQEGRSDTAAMERLQVSTTQYFLPNILTSTYDTDPARLIDLYKEALLLKPQYRVSKD